MYSVNNVARSLESVEKALSRMTITRGNETKGYLACRYAPFESKSHGVPDGMGTNLTSRDFYSAFDLVSDEKGFDCMILPYVPVCAMVTPSVVGGTIKVDGNTFTRGDNWNFDSNAPRWAPLGGVQMGSMTGAPNKPDFTIEQHIASGRIVTVGFRIYYTGQASTCEGTITATSLPIKQDVVETNFRKIAIGLWDGSSLDYAANTVKCVSLDMKPVSGIVSPDAVIVRPEHGLHGVLKRRVAARSHHFKPWWEEGCVMLYDKYGTSSSAAAVGSITDYGPTGGVDGPWTTGRTNIPVVSLVDDDFEAVHLKVRTGAAAKYRLEVITCVQFEHSLGFPLISLTQKALPPVEEVLKKDDALNVAVKPAAPMGSVPLDMSNVALPQRVRRSRQQVTAQSMGPANAKSQSKSARKNRRRRANRRRANNRRARV